MRSLLWSLLVLLGTLAGTSRADIPVVDNPHQAPRLTTVAYREVWRAGADPDEEFLFGVISDADSDAHGNIYLLDRQQQQVFKFTAGGRYRGLVSRAGEGPGEIDMVFGMSTPGGGRLAMLQSFPARIIMVDTLGIPLPSIILELSPDAEGAGGFASVGSLRFQGDRMAGSGSVYLPDGGVQNILDYVCSFTPGGQEAVRYAGWRSGYDYTRPITVDEQAEYHPFATWDMDASGRIYHPTGRDRYEIEVLAPDGQPQLLIRRDWTPHRRSAKEKDEAKSNYRFASNGELPPISYDMADTDPAIGDLQIMGGELWVASPDRQRDLPAGISRRVAVFDLQGRLLEERQFALDLDPARDRAIHLPGGRVVVVKNFRSAHAASTRHLDVQVGDRKTGPDLADEGAVLEVVVYEPV